MIRKLLYPLHQSKMSVCWTKDKKLNRLWSGNTTISVHEYKGIVWAWSQLNRLPWFMLKAWGISS